MKIYQDRNMTKDNYITSRYQDNTRTGSGPEQVRPRQARALVPRTARLAPHPALKSILSYVYIIQVIVTNVTG